MKLNFTKLSIIASVALFAQNVSAQVRGVAFTMAPIGERVWWDEKLGLKDNYLYGGQIGFSFGQNIELRGLYQTSSSLKRDFSYYGVSADQLDNLDVTLERWGGDLKLNLGTGSLLPYLTVGTGVQSSKLGELDKNKQIYFSGGLGIMIGFGDRASLALQALNTSFRDNPVNTLLTDAERKAANLNGADYEYERLKNWSGRAALLFYLGGTKPSDLTEVDKAYINTFSSGLKGISLPIEPMVGKFDWSSKLPYRNTNFGGLATGFDFGPLVGIRGYYLRSFEDELFSGWDKLEIWGGEGKFKLASTGALVPFLNVGGGKINVLDGYKGSAVPVGAKDTMSLEGRAFASGGGGFDIVLSRHIKLSAFAKAMLTSADKNLIENTNSPDDLATSWLYGASLNLILGKKPSAPEYNNNGDSYDKQVKADLDKEKRSTRELRSKYLAQIEKLDKDLEEAYKSGKSSEMTEKFEEQERLKKMVSKLDGVLEKERAANSGSDYVRMNPSEFKALIDEIKESQKRQEEILKNTLELQRMQSELNTERLNARVRALEENSSKKSKDSKDNDEISKLRKELNNLRKKNASYDDEEDEDDEIEELKREIEKRKAKAKKDLDDDSSSKKKIDSEDDDKVSELKKKISDLELGSKSLVDNSDKELEKLRKDLESAKSKKGNQKQVKNLESKISELESNKEKVSGSNAKEVEELRKQLASLEDQKNKVKKKSKSEVEDLEEQLAELRKSKKNKNNDNDEVEDLKRQIAELEKGKKSTKKNAESEADELRKEIAKLKKQKNNSDDDEDFEDSEVKELRKQLSEMKKNRKSDSEDEDLRDDSENLEETAIESFADGRKYSVKGMTFLSAAQLSHNLNDEADTTKFLNKLYYEGASVLGGFNIGGNATFNIGLRQHYRYGKSNFFFMPEAFYGFGSPASFGLFANAIYQFGLKNETSFQPYAGAGLGIMQAGSNAKTKLALNLVLGANLFSVGNGRLYVDLNTRNFFSYNQFALGYRLPF